MVAELLRLKARLLVNAFRVRGARGWAVIGILLGLVLLGALVVALPWFGRLDDVTLRRVVVVSGALVTLATFVIPVVVARSQLVHPRALRTVGLGPAGIAAALLLTTVVGPTALIIPLAFTPLAIFPGEAGVVLAVVPLIVIEAILAARIGVVVGTALRHRPALSFALKLLALLLFLFGVAVVVAHLAPTVAAQLPGRWWPITLSVVTALAPLRDPLIAESLALLPIGTFWRVPSSVHLGQGALAERDALLGLVTLGLLAMLWMVWLRVSLRPTLRIPAARAVLIPGWFARLPSTPTGAVAARSLTYWARDPRYRIVVPVLIAIPAVSLAATAIAGIPFPIGVLVPLPIMTLVLAASTLHNDVAYDSTALWTHLVAQVRGTADRTGRMLPVLLIGVPFVAAGSAAVGLLREDWSVGLAIAGVCSAILLGGIGVSSVVSARSPYPATRPGDPPFQQPQVPGASGTGIQVGSVAAILLVAGPAIVSLVLGELGVPGPWHPIAFLVGSAAGVVAAVVGVRVGGGVYDRRGPELLEFAVRH